MSINMTGAMQILDSSLADKCVCLLGSADAKGNPQISPKGSMMVWDGTHLAYWERAGRTANKNLRENASVVVFYRNTAKGAVWRFYGTAKVYDGGADREAVWDRTIEAERSKDPDKKGAGVIIEVKRITDLNGKAIQE